MNKIIKQIAENIGTPTFIYSEAVLKKNVQRIRSAILSSGLKNKVEIHVSYFANSNPHLMSILAGLDVGVTIQSREENEHLRNIDVQKIVSPTHLSTEDLNYFVQQDLKINIATISNLEKLLALGKKEVNLRVDLSPNGNQR